MVGDHARLDAHATANGGHGNDRPTQDRDIFRSQVSAVRYLVQVFRFGCRFGWLEFLPLSSVIDSALVPFQVAGGSPGGQVAGFLPSAIDSALH